MRVESLVEQVADDVAHKGGGGEQERERRVLAHLDHEVLCHGCFQCTVAGAATCYGGVAPMRRLACFVLLAASVHAADSVDASTLEGKVLFGYQGWFGCPSDGPPA